MHHRFHQASAFGLVIRTAESYLSVCCIDVGWHSSRRGRHIGQPQHILRPSMVDAWLKADMIDALYGCNVSPLQHS